MTSARLLFHQCRKAGINLAADGDDIIFDAPIGVDVPVEQIRRCKTELLAVLRGDYLNAAEALVLTVADVEQRAELIHLFDARVAIFQYDGGMSRGEAERRAYIELARAVSGELSHQTLLDARSDSGMAGKVIRGSKARQRKRGTPLRTFPR